MTDTQGDETPDWIEADDGDVQLTAQKHQSGTKVVVIVLVFGLISFTMQTITSIITLGQASRAETAAQEAKAAAESAEELALANEETLHTVERLTKERVTTAKDIQQIVLDVKGLIETADLLTSDEARQESQRVLANTLNVVLQQADCNTRDAIADAVDEAIAEGALPGSADFVDLRCETDPPPLPGS